MLRCPLEDAAIPPPSAPEPAAWVWLILVAGVLGFELWAVVTHRHTLSQWLGKWTHKLPWLRWVGTASLAFLIWHLFF